MWKFIITMATPSKTLVAPGKPSPPHQVCEVSPGSLHYVHCKKTGRFAPKFAEKSPILNARLARGVLLTLSFFLQTSTTRAIRAYGNDCLLC
jgi:hypothetical protein